MEDCTQIPIVIIAWNNLFFVQKFVEQIRGWKYPIIILDNNSTFQPLLDYYRVLKGELRERLTLYMLDQNYGHEVYKKRMDLLPSLYVISDPDLELNQAMPANVVEHLMVISRRYGLRKVGLALDISEPEKFIAGSYGKLVHGIESGYYQNQIEDPDYTLYIAPTDTTFCLVNTEYDENRNLRVGGPFTAKHLPWYDGYLAKNIPRDELLVWIRENKSSSILQYVDPQSLLV
jgi:hypothetical protein